MKRLITILFDNLVSAFLIMAVCTRLAKDKWITP